MQTIKTELSRRTALGLGLVSALGHSFAGAVQPPDQPLALVFRSQRFLHRWSKAGQNEFTPEGQEDLAKWIDMLTINVYDDVHDGDALALVANRVVTKYQNAGKVLGTHSIPRTPDSPAEHFIAAVLGTPKLMECVFGRFMLREGVGNMVVYSHRIYGDRVENEVSSWLRANGSKAEAALMALSALPSNALLQTLPQSP